MTGTIVQASNVDSIHIECSGEGRAVTIPAVFLLAADRVLRTTLDSYALHVQRFPSSPDRLPWMAYISYPGGTVEGYGDTPWAALLSLAQRLEHR